MAPVAYGINDSGQIVGGYLGTDQYYHGFMYSNGGYTTLDDSNGAYPGTLAFRISEARKIVGTNDSDVY